MNLESLSDLAPELLILIARHLSSEPDSPCRKTGLSLPEFVLESNRLTTKNYESIVALSATCSLLRNLLGPMIFSHLSLVRANQIDALMASPSRLRRFSDSSKIQARYFNENGHKCPLSSQFVSYLECDNTVIPRLAAGCFANVQSLKVLDVASISLDSNKTTVLPLINLAVNVSTLTNSAVLLQSLSLAERLDLLIDFYEVSPVCSLQKIPQMSNLKHLNLIVTLPLALKFRDIDQFITRFLPSLETLQIRLIGSNIQNGEANLLEWASDACLENTWPYILSDLPRFSHFAIDEAILQSLQLPEPTSRRLSTKSRAFTLVQKSLGVPRFTNTIKDNVARLFAVLGVSCFQLNYGEVIDQSHVQALNALHDMISFVNEGTYTLKTASLEQCWSIAGQALSRDYYMSLIRNSAAKDRLKTCTAWDKLPVHAPRYLIQETFDVKLSDLKARHGTAFETEIRSQFWSVETSLIELQQYSLQQKPPSGLWG